MQKMYLLKCYLEIIQTKKTPKNVETYFKIRIKTWKETSLKGIQRQTPQGGHRFQAEEKDKTPGKAQRQMNQRKQQKIPENLIKCNQKILGD